MASSLLLLLALVGAASSELAAQSTTNLPSLLDRARLSAGTDSFVVTMQGRPVGWQRHVRISAQGGWEVRDAVTLGGMVEQESVIAIGADANERSLRQRGTMRGKPMTIALDFAVVPTGVRVVGSADTPSNPAGVLQIDTVVPVSSVDDNAVAPLLYAVPWRTGLDVTVPVVSSGKGVVEAIRLRVIDTATVTVPAGTFAVWHVEQESRGIRVRFDITRQAPYRLVRMQQVGTPLEIVLASSQSSPLPPR